MTSLLEMEYAVDDCSRLFMQKLGEFADKNKTIDLGAWLCVFYRVVPFLTDKLYRQFYAFDVVGELTFQKKLGFLEKGDDVDGIIKVIGMGLFYTVTVGQVPAWHKILLGNPLLPIFLPVRFCSLLLSSLFVSGYELTQTR